MIVVSNRLREDSAQRFTHCSEPNERLFATSRDDKDREVDERTAEGDDAGEDGLASEGLASHELGAQKGNEEGEEEGGGDDDFDNDDGNGSRFSQPDVALRKSSVLVVAELGLSTELRGRVRELDHMPGG